MVTKQEFSEWKGYPVTKVVYNILNQRIWEIREEFDTADADTLKYRQGYIQALKDVLDMDSEQVEG